MGKKAKSRKTKADLERENKLLRDQMDNAKALAALLVDHRFVVGQRLISRLVAEIREFRL